VRLSYAYISISIISLVLIFASLIIVSKKEHTKSKKALSLVIGFIFIGSLFTLCEMLSTSFEGKFLFRNLSQIGLFLLPSASYNFIMIYTNTENKVLNKMRRINFIFAIACVLLIFTNDYHGIMRSNVLLVPIDGGFKLSVVQTVFGKICVSLNTLMNVIAIIKLWIYKRTTTKSTRTQVYLVLIGFLIPFLFTYVKTMLRNVSGLEVPSSIGFLIGVICILVGIYKYDFMSISPLARDWVIDEIDIGMIFTNPDGRIVDVNAYAKKIFSEDLHRMEKIIFGNSTWENALLGRDNMSFELHQENHKKIYKIKVHDLSKKQKAIGSVSLITDITADKLHKEWLENKAQKDSLTKILNRESFELKVNKIIDSIADRNRSGALLIFDIDKFKDVNDNYGHQIGDKVIIEVANIIASTCREKDLVGRLGGDEFGMFIVDTSREDVDQLVYRIQERLASQIFVNGDVDITLSIGIHIQELKNCTFNELYNKSDQAMYASKKSGRNQATVF